MGLNTRIKIVSLIALLTPSLVFAFPGNLTAFACLFFDTFNILVPILIGIAFLLFFWGVAKFILSAGNEKELANGRQFMIWGILALFILMSFWGIMQFLAAQFDFGSAGWPVLPTGGVPSESCSSGNASGTGTNSTIEFGCIPGTSGAENCVN